MSGLVDMFLSVILSGAEDYDTGALWWQLFIHRTRHDNGGKCMHSHDAVYTNEKVCNQTL